MVRGYAPLRKTVALPLSYFGKWCGATLRFAKQLLCR